MRVIYTYTRYIIVTTDYWDIRPSGTTRQIYTIKLALESTHQDISDDILYIIWRLVFIEIYHILI